MDKRVSTHSSERDKERMRAWHKANYERVREARREYFVEYRRKNREKRAAYNRKYADEHREQIRDKQRRWRTKNKTSARYLAYFRKKNGFNLAVIERCLRLQNNACAICLRPFSGVQRICADHCHDTKTPRGLLCNHCNTSEGSILKTGLSPLEFGKRLHAYLADPPASRVT